MPDRLIQKTNVLIRLTPCRNAGKGRLLLSRLEGTKPEGAELYRVRDRAAGERMAKLLRGVGREVKVLSADAAARQDARVRAWFRAAPRPALVAVGSLPFPDGRGDCRRLAVMNLPPSLESAVRDLAATGSDGLASEAEFFASAGDRDSILVASAGADAAESVNQVVAWMENDGCARVFLARRMLGQTRGVCGQCSWCLGRKSMFLPYN